MSCVSGGDCCQRADQCVTLEVWQKIQAAVDGVVDHITLEDLVARYHEKCPNGGLMGLETKTPWPRRTRGQGFSGMGRGFWARRLPFYRNALESQADGNPVGQGVAVTPIHLYDLHLGVLRHGAGQPWGIPPGPRPARGPPPPACP